MYSGLRFKHDNDGTHKYFISLMGNEMTFYFSYMEFEKHRLMHEGKYTHHKFKKFEKAIDFYEYQRACRSYKCIHSADDLRNEYLNATDPFRINYNPIPSMW